MYHSIDERRRMLLPGPRLPPTPESAAEPTFLPHVREPLPSLLAPPGAGQADITLSARSGTSGPIHPSNGAVCAGLNLLLHSRDALMYLHHLYATSASAQHAFSLAVSAIANTVKEGGRLVVSGVGKSGKVGEKIVATCNSLQVRACWMHATEAVHGDLGMLGPSDCVMLISYSATTPELLNLVPHVPVTLPLIVMTAAFDALMSPEVEGPAYVSESSHTESTSTATMPCPIFADRPADGCTNIILPAPIPVSEAAALGISAPTTSTTVAMALGDALAIAVAGELHERPCEVFRRHHPGGTIGLGR